MILHLGCGSRHIDLPGWVHIDAIPHPHIDLCHPVDTLPMYQDGSVDGIYACHIVEHFMRVEVKRVLREWYRVMKVGAFLRIPVPNFTALLSVYEATGSLGTIIGPLFGRQDYLYNFHYMVYDLKTLGGVLRECGFRDVREYDWRKTDHAHVDDYSQAYFPHMDKDNGTLLSLNIEATK